MRRLRQAIRGRIHAFQCRLNERIEELAFQASVRAIRETQWMARDLALDAANQALAAYVPPTPWADEVTQVLDTVIAEQFRLQGQVEALEQLLREALSDRPETADSRQEPAGNGRHH